MPAESSGGGHSNELHEMSRYTRARIRVGHSNELHDVSKYTRARIRVRLSGKLELQKAKMDQG